LRRETPRGNRAGADAFRAFWSVTYGYNGKRCVASVGERDHLTGATVLAIFQSARDPLLFWPLVGDSCGYQPGGMVRVDSDSLVRYFEG
jgi:hypothetical protein